MPATTIVDNGASIKLTIGAQIRNVTKNQIIEISVIKNDIIKIDIGQGALHNIFIPYGDVTAPVTASAAALRDKLNEFMPVDSSESGPSSTEAKQDLQIGLLTTINDSLGSLKNLATKMDDKVFYEPVLVDDGGAGIIYKGYAMPGTSQESPQWAIERIRREGDDVHVSTWADGNKNFDNSWLNREALIYS